MKRKLTLLLSAAVASSCFSGTVYGASFRDINDVPWSGAGAVINNVADLGLLSGYEDGTFRARNNVTYCEAVQMLYTTLLKTGMAQPLQAVDSYRYTSFLNTYRVPKWAHIAVSYCLEKGILTTADIMKFTTNGKSNPATREDVAKMFGSALAVRYDVDSKSASAAEFSDYWRISTEAMPLVDLLKRLGIVSGDNNAFKPKEPINRAEMAVMLNKTYEVLTQGIGSTGEITQVSQNDGKYFFFDIKMDVTGYTESYHAVAGNVKAYGGEGNQEISLSRISKGDKVSIVRNGDSLSSIRLLSAVSDQEKYDVTGYIVSFYSNLLSLENENTGDIDKYSIGSGCICYLDGRQVTKKELQDEYKKRSDEHAYVGLMIGTSREKVSYEDEDGKKSTMKDVEVAEELHVTFSDDYTMSGEVRSLSKTNLNYVTAASGTERALRFASDCEYYIGSRKASIDDMVEMGDSGTTYVKVTVDKTEKAVKVILSEEPFSSRTNTDTANKIFDLLGFSEKKMIIKDTGEKVTYNFGSSNPTSNITFYTWNSKDDEWSKVSLRSADKYYDDADDDKIYCSIEFNNGGKIKAVYLSTKKAAWRQGGEQTERKGVVDSVKGNTLKFKTATTSYNLLKQYNADVKEDDDGNSDDNSIYIGPDANGKTVRYPLVITSAVTSSRTVFEKMANSDDVELYAEILADAANNVIKIDAKLTKAQGTLVEYERNGDGGSGSNPKPKRYITIQTSDGAKLNLNIVNTPRLGCEDDEYTLEDIESTGYVGALLELGFNSSGEVNKITVLEESNRGMVTVKGTAASGTGGLKIKGDSNVYPWLGRRSVTIRHKSMNSESLDKLIELLDDSDTTVYVSAKLDEKYRVDTITVRVEAAEGTLQEYDDDDHIVRIKTNDGHTLSFLTVTRPECDVNGVTDRTKLDDKCRGKYVELIFNSDGLVSEITD